MVTPAEAAEHRQEVVDLSTLAVAALVAEWSSLPLDAPEAARDVFADLLAELADQFATPAAAVGADWYEDLRRAAGVPGGFTARMPDLPGEDFLRASGSYAASALYVSPDKALADMAAIAEQLVADADRAAVEVNVNTDPAEPRWARIAQPDACAFCALLASRGPAYREESTAAFAAHGGKYHRQCGCVAAPVWRDDQFELPDYASKWVDAYDQARAEVGPGAGLKETLARMRDVGDLR